MRTGAIPILGLLLGAIACTGRVTPPTTHPTPRASPTSSPTAPATLTPTASTLEHPMGATEVVLRMSIGGGLRYPGATVEEPPAFTLYGDGRVIYATPRQVEHWTRYDLFRAQLTEEQVGALLEFALRDAGLSGARGYYGDVPIADDGTTIFQINAGGFQKMVMVYALGHSDADHPDADARAKFEPLYTKLWDFETFVSAGDVVDLGVFEPETYLVTLDEPFHPEVTPVAWPWDDLEPAEFDRQADSGRSAYLSAEQVKALADPVNSVPNDVIVAGPDGTDYLVRVKPLLPDEVPN